MSWIRALMQLFDVVIRKKEPPASGAKLTREDVLGMIEKNGGPKELDLSRRDLSQLDLGREAISRHAEAVWRQEGKSPAWQNPRTGGINLRGARLTDANLFGANLAYAELSEADLIGAQLRASCLTKAALDRACLRGIECNEADLSGVIARNANLEDADLALTDLSGADFDGASLRGTSLYKARLSGTRLSRRELGEVIVQEKPETLRAFLSRHHRALTPEALDDALKVRQLEEARQVYASLKANFLETGNFDDASWAHIKERQMAKKTHHPRRARHYYKDEFPGSPAGRATKWWGFYLRHTTKWLLEWAAELTCGCGERPLRTVAWAGLILLLFPFLYAWSGGLRSMAESLSWLDYFNYSLGAFTTIGFGQFEATTPFAQTLTSVQALLGISILALLMFALGNRISRS